MQLLEIWQKLLLPSEYFKWNDAWQLIVLGGILILGSTYLRTPAKGRDVELTSPLLWLQRNVGFIVAWMCSVIATLVYSFSSLENDSFFRFFAFLGGFWLIIGLLCSLLRARFWARSLAFVLYTVIGLHAFSLSGNGLSTIKEFEFSLGSLNISLWDIAIGIFAFAITLWISMGLAQLAEKQIKKLRRLSPSLKVLITKIVRIIFILIATMITLNSMGINLTSLTVFGGAIGLGLGFGLQKVVSNFVSGIILLLDNSIKPGDVIEIDGTYGWINNLRARYASVITRDGTEHLIPNEDLITQKVINWSFTDELVRIRVPIGVSYNADPHHCIQLILEAVKSHERVLTEPPAVCLLKEFGDSSVNLELRFWIADPANGIGSIRSRVLLSVWDTFKENNIEIPFPQRDLHIRTSEILRVQRDAPDPD